MVQELSRIRPKTQAPQSDFPESAPAANPVFFRTYSRRTDQGRETWSDVCDRTITGLAKLGKLTNEEFALLDRMQRTLKTTVAARYLWVGNTSWLELPENYSGAFNCTSRNVTDWDSFGIIMGLAMQGCGTGAVLEPKYISQLPTIKNRLNITMIGETGQTPKELRRDETEVKIEGNHVYIHVGDSRQGWVKSYQTLLELASNLEINQSTSGTINVSVDLSDVRPMGETLKGFGGVANPTKLAKLYGKVAEILNEAIGRQLNSVECCLLIDEAALVVVSGNIRRCLPEDALVHTFKGLIPIKNIQIGDLVQTPLGFRRVVNKFDQGFQDVYEIETNATYPRGTLNHKQAILADAKGNIEWKSIGDLTTGDRLVHNTQILRGTYTQLPPDFTATRPPTSTTIKPFVIPPLTPEIAWLIGLTHGDGYIALGRNKHDKPYGRIEWAMNSLDTLVTAQIQTKIDEALALFGLTATHSLVKGENTAKSICSSMRMAEYFYRYIKQPKTPLVVPDFILQGSIDIRAAYLAGLMDSDGSVKTHPPYLVTSVYPGFIRQVGTVLSSLGIAGRLGINYPENETWQVKYSLKIPAFKDRYNNLIAPHSAKGELHQGLKMYGFTIPGVMMRETYNCNEMSQMGFSASRFVDANYERYIDESDTLIDIPVTVKGLGSYDHVQTYDIEVEEAHCFYCDGYLTHNSAGIKQSSNDDQLFAQAKDNLWQQDENGNWRIDPKRDALRMSNHTIVYHQKPSLEECIASVRKQYYSGEGAMMWAGEAIARANQDLLNTFELKREFLKEYDRSNGKEWLHQRYPFIPEDELNHRLARYGLNPCITADTWVHTEQGPRQVKDLIGKQLSVYVNGELFSTTTEGFWFTGIKPIFKVITQEGYELRLTGNHQLLKVTAQTQKKQYTQWEKTQDLSPGDYILVHNHRDLQPWESFGTFEEGWLIGNLIGDGSLSTSKWGTTADLRYWQEDQVQMREYAMKALEKTVNYSNKTEGKPHKKNKYRQVSSSELAKLAEAYGVTLKHKIPTEKIEQASYEFYRGFLRGLFDADGSVQGSQVKGVSIRLSQSNLETLQIVQRMLARLGIISTIYQERRTEGDRFLPDSNRQLTLYHCKAQHELVISNDNLYYFQQIVGFSQPEKDFCLKELLSGYKRKLNNERFAVKIQKIVPDGMAEVYDCTVPGVSQFDANGIVAHNCGEIIGADFHCNLSQVHLDQINPKNQQEQEDAFKAAGLAAASMLQRSFIEPRFKQSRDWDPIVGVSFGGLFDFFVTAFGVDWLHWWEQGRPDTPQGLEFKLKEQDYLNFWKKVSEDTVWEYCDRHSLKRPNRCTTVQPSGTKVLLTGGSPGWHPPKSQRFIRRITFNKNNPIALACIDYGYQVVPSPDDKDEKGNLLHDPFDPRCNTWLVEIPTEVSWANLPGADAIDISKFSALAQVDFFMQVQRHFVTHNTSSTIELREHEVEILGQRIWSAIQTDEGYISTALLARFDDHETFPRLPFEPITKAEYDTLVKEVLQRRQNDNFVAALQRYDLTGSFQKSEDLEGVGPAGCDTDKCLMPDLPPNG